MPPITSSDALKILTPPPGGRPGFTGSFIRATLTQVGTPACGLPSADSALLLEAAFAARLRRLGRAPAARHVERVRQPLAQALQCQLAVARRVAPARRAAYDVMPVNCPPVTFSTWPCT